MCWCGFKKSRLVKEQEVKSLLSNSGIKTPLNKFHCLILKCIKMNETVNKFLFAGDKFMTEMHLKQPGFTYNACVLFTKKQRKNWKIYADRKYRFYLQKWAW